MADGPAGFTQNSSCSALLRIPLRINALRIQACHLLRGRFPAHLSSRVFADLAVLQPPPRRNGTGLGWSPVARHYWGNHSCFLFLRVLRCFSSPRLPPHMSMTDLQSAGLSHSEIRGSRDICTSPRLFAAYHVLLRLREPRHPPCALDSFFVLVVAQITVLGDRYPILA